MLPYLFPNLAAFPTVADLITHLRTSDTRYRAALPAEFCAKNPPPLYITLNYIVTRLPDSLRLVKDHFLSVCPTTLTVDLLEERLLAAEKSIVAVGASRGSALRLPLASDAAPARARGARELEGLAGAVEVVVAAVEGVGVVVRVVAGVVAAVAAVEAEEAAVVAEGAEVAEAAEVAEGAEEAEVAAAAVELVATLRRGVGLVVVRASSSSAVVRPCPLSSFVSGTLRITAVGVLVPAVTAGVAMFDLDYDAILAAMYAVTVSVEGECFLCVPPDSGIEAAALGAGEATAPGTSVSAAPGAGESALSGLYLPSFSTNLVSGADLQDRGVDQFTLANSPLAPPSWSPLGAWPPMSLSLVSSGLSLPYLRGLPLPASPHSSEFPPTKAPLKTLHMDVWGPARVRGQGHERYFLLVVVDYSRNTIVFPLRSKGDVTEVLIDWIRAARLQLRESFGSDFPVLPLHSDRGGEFSSARLCRAQGIRQTFTLRASRKQNGIAERRIGMVMDVAYTSMIHAAAPHFVWPFAVQYAAHKLNLQPRVSLLETSPTLRWTGKVGDASAFRFYHPTSRRVLSSQDVTFDESVPYYRLIHYRTAPLPPPPLFLTPSPPPVDPLPPLGPASSSVSQVDAVERVEVDVDSGAAGGAEPADAEPLGAEFRGAELGGAEPGGAETRGAEPGGAESRGAEPGGAEPGGAEPRGARSARVAPRGVSSRRKPLSPEKLREWS
ncbi:unnamed protein product [Closterium sp. NIES-65]|nr:unnamed protein product [Closterium sp. NIES-65]